MSGGADAEGGTLGILVSLVHVFGLLAAAEVRPNAGPQPFLQACRWAQRDAPEWRGFTFTSACSFCRASIPSAEDRRRDTSADLVRSMVR